MNFRIYLRYPEKLNTVPKDLSYSPQKHEVTWEMCKVMNRTNEIEFYIKGISYKERMTGLRLSVDWDLAVMLEQLPDVLRKISDNDYNFRIDFYEQGSEFFLQFSSDESEVVDVTYNSYSGNVSCSASVEKSELSAMFKKIYKDFIFLSKTICGYLYEFNDTSINTLLSVEELS